MPACSFDGYFPIARVGISRPVINVFFATQIGEIFTFSLALARWKLHVFF